MQNFNNYRKNGIYFKNTNTLHCTLNEKCNVLSKFSSVEPDLFS